MYLEQADNTVVLQLWKVEDIVKLNLTNNLRYVALSLLYSISLYIATYTRNHITQLGLFCSIKNVSYF